MASPLFHSKPGAESSLNYERHKTYWLRCLRTYLPTLYTSNDSNRLTLAFFIISALDLLGLLQKTTTLEEREGYTDWLYRLQHPEGGFRGTPATELGKWRNVENAVWDPANLPATFFALATLSILGDDLSRVKKKECLQWLNKLQRANGSFGETLGENERVEGGTDSRFGYCGLGVRWMLRGDADGEVLGVPDIALDKFVECLNEAETYDGGISEAPFHEAHAGFTYCAIAALSFASRLPNIDNPFQTSPSAPITGLTNVTLTLHWLLARQTATLDDDDAFDTNNDETDTPATCHDAHSFVKMDDFLSLRGKESYKNRPTSHFDLQWIGFNGRCNKVADTCYGWWVLGSLAVLGKAKLANEQSVRRYLLDKTQHIIGGFGKQPGDPPDIYHSYLGLATLCIIGEQQLKPINPALCFSEDAKTHIESLAWRKKILSGRADSVGEAVAAHGDIKPTSIPEKLGSKVMSYLEASEG